MLLLASNVSDQLITTSAQTEINAGGRRRVSRFISLKDRQGNLINGYLCHVRTSLRKHSVVIVCPLTPPNEKVWYSTLPSNTNPSPPPPPPSSPPAPSNQALSSGSVQLQLVTMKYPPGLTILSTRSLYPSHGRRPSASVSALRDTASNVPLSRTTSHPWDCAPARTVERGPARTSHSRKEMVSSWGRLRDEAIWRARATECGL